MGTILKAWKTWVAGVTGFTADNLNAMQPQMGAYADLPATPTAGQTYFATDTATLYICFVAGTWAVSGVSNAKVGSATHDTSVTGTQTIAHGLGKTPKLTRIIMRAIYNTGGSYFAVSSDGSYDGTNNRCSHTFFASSSSSSNVGTTDSYIIYYNTAGTSGTTSTATAAVDGTNITLTWVKIGTPTGTISFLWEAIG